MHCARPFSIGVDDPDPADHRQWRHPIVRRIHDSQNHEREVGERNEGEEAVPDENDHEDRRNERCAIGEDEVDQLLIRVKSRERTRLRISDERNEKEERKDVPDDRHRLVRLGIGRARERGVRS